MSEQEKKKNGKGKLIAIIAAALAVVIAAFCWFSGLAGGISEAEAKEIAYNQVPGSAALDNAVVIKEFDDFKMVYEIQFTHENTLYEFQIAAKNGKILDRDIDGTPTHTQNVTEQAPTESTQQDGQTTQTDIGIEKAKEIALSQVSGATHGHITEAKSDYEYGKLVYEIEICHDGQEYDFEIDAATGSVVGRSQESVHHEHHEQ